MGGPFARAAALTLDLMLVIVGSRGTVDFAQILGESRGESVGSRFAVASNLFDFSA